MNELDSSNFNSTDVIAQTKITELFEGAVTPLTIAVCVECLNRGVDKILERFHIANSAKSNAIFLNFNNHVFTNMSKMYNVCQDAFRTNNQEVDIGFCNTLLPSTKKNMLTTHRDSSWLYRAMKYFFQKSLSVYLIEDISDRFTIEQSEEPMTYFNNIVKNLATLTNSSYNLLISVVTVGKQNEKLSNLLVEECKVESAIAAAFIKDISVDQNIEAKNLQQSIRDLIEAFKYDNPVFLNANDKALAQYISTNEGVVFEKYENFMFCYGHRGFHEAELRSKPFNSDLILFVNHLKGLAQETPSKDVTTSDIIDSFISQYINKKLYRKVRSAINAYVKSLQKYFRILSFYIKTVDIFRASINSLAADMVKLGALPDADLIYFLKLNEIKMLLTTKRYLIILIAKHRRKLYEQQSALSYAKFYIGKPITTIK
jgi:hypothetical protein